MLRRESMDGDFELLKRIYDRFNAQDMEGVLTALADDVAWANGMDGGHVHGREAVRAYWTRQWAMVRPHVGAREISPDGGWRDHRRGPAVHP
jgi:ketosteroid isomerase-like protein